MGWCERCHETNNLRLGSIWPAETLVARHGPTLAYSSSVQNPVEQITREPYRSEHYDHREVVANIAVAGLTNEGPADYI